MLRTAAKTEAPDAQQELTDGFHLVIDALKLNGLTTIYGVPGIPITDFGHMAQAEGIRVLSFRHEQNAGYAAAIAGFLTKKPGVCLTVSAPGFLNGLTALAHATTHCFPMIQAIAAAVETGKPVLAVEGDSAFGFSGMEVETICRYNLPVCVVIFNNNGIYRGTDVNKAGSDPAPTVFVAGARYDKMMEAFGGVGVNATSPDELKRAVNAAMDSGKPTLINAVIDPAAGSESGRIGNLNPQSKLRKK
jgi:thiamine pyrophosphate-dependent acetolactate synthase large subunit-like protein